MRRTRSDEILSAVYAARIEAVEALRETAPTSQHNGARLKQAADELELSAALYEDAPVGAIYLNFAQLLRVAKLFVEWRRAVLNAEADTQRFLTAAKERIQSWLKENASHEHFEGLTSAAKRFDSVSSVADVEGAVMALGTVALPIGLYVVEKRSGRFHDPASEDNKQQPVELEIAFLKFTLDGKPLAEVHYVSPGETHDLDIEVRVSRWPAGATELVLEPLTTEPAGTYDVPSFRFEAPMGSGPFKLTQKGRAILRVPQHMLARPFEFIYAARFLPTESEQPVETAGQRTLLLEGSDVARNPLTGYSKIDMKLIEVRNQLRVAPGVSQQELSDALVVVYALGNFLGQIAQDNIFPGFTSEAEFQKTTRMFLRGKPTIGSELEEHPHAGGGITDLSFRGIRIELKVETDKVLQLSDCGQYVDQTASYTISSGKSVGVLCVLDSSKKETPAFPLHDGIGVFSLRQGEGSPVHIFTLLMQGNLAKPSQLSR